MRFKIGKMALLCAVVCLFSNGSIAAEKMNIQKPPPASYNTQTGAPGVPAPPPAPPLLNITKMEINKQTSNIKIGQGNIAIFSCEGINKGGDVKTKWSLKGYLDNVLIREEYPNEIQAGKNFVLAGRYMQPLARGKHVLECVADEENALGMKNANNRRRLSFEVESYKIKQCKPSLVVRPKIDEANIRDHLADPDVYLVDVHGFNKNYLVRDLNIESSHIGGAGDVVSCTYSVPTNGATVNYFLHCKNAIKTTEGQHQYACAP